MLMMSGEIRTACGIACDGEINTTSANQSSMTLLMILT